ncbi:MAG TPA: type I-E CRISPR-associated protein Cas7/Cse4/CasC [Pseudonocardiaceae bacterium]
MSTRIYADIHILQTVPPSNLNRDDAGSPKQAIYGGARRARVSSQAWKRATRKAFTDKEQAPAATRTKRLPALVAQRLYERTGIDLDQAQRIAAVVPGALDVTLDKKRPNETSYLLFFGLAQLDRLVALLAEQVTELVAADDKALAAAVKALPLRDELGKGHPIDVALFGRMVADVAALNVDAATQVAHAISTHAVEIEFDYFTAVDDEKDRAGGDDAGAGMIGTVEFNSATLYRFATVGLHQLRVNLDDDAEATVEALGRFVDAFCRSMPTGHENTFAHRTLPSLVSVVLRDDQPVNLVSAFETPVRSSQGILTESQRLLVAELRRAHDQWGLNPLLVASTYTPAGDGDAEVLGTPLPFPDLVTAVTDAARERLA